ncbi:hypothetical protein [Treponema brennaborense]|uniref:ABC transporter permease n=1 Tax=Treponema brennaborense (strain DSM 12168 / CIP 105900 / DD5/3) TaxID=906968 RepID=F4LIL1_TREBD|nr:hypothetical protein [Treponema brennaborense]AEE17236.1 ABC transporter permease [Treponema brennaborense DSM 12168]
MTGFRTLFIGDVRFQIRYGFYVLYAFFTLLYTAIVAALPESWRYEAAVVCIFSDPATLGLFFMGAVILFEKSQRVLDSINVAPVSKTAYVAAKVCSFAVVSLAVGFAIGLASGAVRNAVTFAAGLLLSSSLFTFAALCVASRCGSLNAFVLGTVPVEIAGTVPGILYQFGIAVQVLQYHPSAAVIDLLRNCNAYGETLGIGGVGLRVAVLLVWNVLSFFAARHFVRRMFSELGGVRL